MFNSRVSDHLSPLSLSSTDLIYLWLKLNHNSMSAWAKHDHSTESAQSRRFTSPAVSASKWNANHSHSCSGGNLQFSLSPCGRRSQQQFVKCEFIGPKTNTGALISSKSPIKPASGNINPVKMRDGNRSSGGRIITNRHVICRVSFHLRLDQVQVDVTLTQLYQCLSSHTVCTVTTWIHH